ncbi:response regulator [Candidatus Poribacteria bacterium]|nr:response regulator [Candidatus Poribacteria bacterium]
MYNGNYINPQRQWIMDYKGKILVVDDEPDIGEVLKTLLDEKGYDVKIASCGLEALAKAMEITPDLILLDVMLPDIDGFEVCRRIREDSLLNEIPVIMVTCLEDKDSRLKGVEAGADDFISKPYDHSELLARVRTITRLNRYRQLESKISRLSALYQIPGAINSHGDVDTLLEFIAQQTKRLLDVEGVSIIFNHSQRGTLQFSSVASEEEGVAEKLKRLKLPSDTGIAGWVLREGKTALVKNPENDERFYGEFDEHTGHSTKSVLCTPLISKGETIGVIEAINKKEGEFTEEDKAILQAMAHNVVVSIEKWNLNQDLQKAEALLKNQGVKHKRTNAKNTDFDCIIGKSGRIQKVIAKAQQVALTDSTVLIYGDTGTGKELMAQSIHSSSLRYNKKFIPINCGAIPENLLESELFGHEKGAFTGATSRRIGRFEEADGGTIFLDEIGDMPYSLQVKLLRVLEARVIRPLGTNKIIPVDVRVIAATNQNLEKMVNDEKFRQDLYYRLKVFELELPPLSERREDIPLLIDHFISLYNEKLGKNVFNIDDKSYEILCNYSYPGNIRELKHIIETAMIVTEGNTITPDVFPIEIRNSLPESEGINIDDDFIATPKNDRELKEAKAKIQQKIECMFLNKLLSENNGNVSQAAREAGMNRSWLSQLISRHNIDLDQYRNSVSNQ